MKQILVLGSSGFIGRNVVEYFRTRNFEVIEDDRLIGISCVAHYDPDYVINLIGYGGHPHQTDVRKIYDTNFILTEQVLSILRMKKVMPLYIHAGSSSEYGGNCCYPDEQDMLTPNSHYAVSKGAAANLIYYYGKHLKFPCVNLRLYSVYGKYEQETRLVPTLIKEGKLDRLPSFVNPNTSRDFIHVDDVCLVILQTIAALTGENYGESFNIGTGERTTIREVAAIARRVMGISLDPQFTMDPRIWDCTNWVAKVSKAKKLLGWSAKTKFEDGLRKLWEDANAN